MDGGLISTIDLMTKFDLAIKFVDALVIKNKPYNLNSFSLLRGVWGLCCLTPTIAIYFGREG